MNARHRAAKPDGMPQLRTTLTHASILAALCIIAYIGTIHSPMLWDERAFLLDNPATTNISIYLSPSDISESPMHPLLIRRYVGMLSFASNRMLSGGAVESYHAVNIAVHLACTLLVYLIARLLLSSSAMREHWAGDYKGRAALLAALIFGLHPVQTEAVTYIFQRFASMSAMFCLAAMALYAAHLNARSRRVLLYTGALICMALAMKTKENAFAFPLIIALADVALYHGRLRERALRLAPFIATMLIVPWGVYWTPSASAGLHDAATMDYTALQYASAQPMVVVRYMGLFILPIGQCLEHDVSTYASLTHPMTLGPLALHLGLLAGALHLIRRGGVGRMAGLGLVWFYIALSVESSFVAIPMLMDEYRMYLPIAGLCIGLAPAAIMGMERLGGRARPLAYALAFLIVPAILLAFTISRNEVWKSGIALWSDVVKKSPMRLRGYNNLGNEYSRAGMRKEAMAAYEAGIKASGAGPAQPLHLSELHYNLAIEYDSLGNRDGAARNYELAALVNPANSDALNNLGIIHMDKGDLGRAESVFKEAIAASGANLAARFNLGETYIIRFNEGGAKDAQLLRMALPHIEAYAKAHPDYAPALEYLRMIREKTGQ